MLREKLTCCSQILLYWQYINHLSDLISTTTSYDQSNNSRFSDQNETVKYKATLAITDTITVKSKEK